MVHSWELTNKLTKLKKNFKKQTNIDQRLEKGNQGRVNQGLKSKTGIIKCEPKFIEVNHNCFSIASTQHPRNFIMNR